MLNNSSFYPTPKTLAFKMIGKIKGDPQYILDPSAGKGDLIEAYCGKYRFNDYRSRCSAIEIDETLQATIRGKGIQLIDSDFLSYSGQDKFDLILMNPPFHNGDKHLQHAIDIMYSGQIVCLLNAETLKNQCTSGRRALASQLEELGAEIEYLQGAFEEAERKTSVEVALVNVVIERRVEEDLFAGCEDQAIDFDEKIEENYEVSTGKKIEELVAEYNQVAALAIETIAGFYRNYKKVGRYIGLNQEPKYQTSGANHLTQLMTATCNETVRTIRRDFWRRTLDLPEVKSRLTKKRLEEFEQSIKYCTGMDYTESNIRTFLLNLISGYDDALTKAVLEVFERFSRKYAWDESIHNGNVHYFNGWKTNDSFRVGKKVIIPCYGSYGGAFWDNIFKRFSLNWQTANELRDIDIVMNYFDGLANFVSVSQALEQAFKEGKNSKIESTYFRITAHKKGTLHLTFKDENILRRFNLAACRGKGWLPMDYGKKPYQDMTAEEQKIVETFEIGGPAEYIENLGQDVFEKKWSAPLMLEAA